MRCGVERAGHDVIDRGRRQTGDLGPQFVAHPSTGGGDLGLRPGLEVGDLGDQTAATLAEDRFGLDRKSTRLNSSH